MLYPRESSTREVKELGGFWEFAKDKENVGVKKRWFVTPPGHASYRRACQLQRTDRR